MISSVAYNCHPFFRFKADQSQTVASVSETKTISSVNKKAPLNTSERHPPQLSCHWVETGKSYPKMEMQWIVIESRQDEE